MNENTMYKVQTHVECQRKNRSSKKRLHLSALRVQRATKAKKKAQKKIIEFFAVILVSIILYRAGAEDALQQRGYYAVGGEFLLLALPVLYYPIKQTIKDLVLQVLFDGHS